MFRKIICHISTLSLLLLFFSVTNVHAQQMQKISGMVFEKGTSSRLSEVNVSNLRTKKSVVSNGFGVFLIEASIGDSLSFSKVGYSEAKTVIGDLKDFYVELQPGIKLETVLVERKTKEAELNEAMRDYGKKGVYNGGNNKFGTYLASPATALYNLFGREAKNAKRFSRFLDSEKRELEVDKVFSKEAVGNITKLTDKDLESFMRIYRPSYDTIENWQHYDFLEYVQRSLTDFNKNGRPEGLTLPDIEVKTQEK
ncbi:hypothetical protein LZQ00_14840 [Sphingobacterium sp. SRCM116780]|uniref:hypothetical protein n=1 Tax=Sphingobacterium sp. SRCM116780 TaxID=2907623 RepID=UPI001F2917C7|nr:hypothetical protein [Sphingobacterium sp. SRCM116780]UIR55534.1 hypothetical protein LZQ00_14840 [Sphingobacterium sp. SRCM116780]